MKARMQRKSWFRQYVGVVGLVTVVALLVGVFLHNQPGVFAGGPANRPTFTSAEPADYVAFNAITDNPKHGDERNFVLIREAGKGTYVNEIKLQPGKEYEVYSYFHNNAKSRLNTGEGTGIARNTRMRADVPTVVQPGERGKISTIISADNANPRSVWDEAYVTTDSAVSLRYVPASAVITSGGAVNGSVLSDSLFSQNGTFLGYGQLNGILPGCADFAGYVIYRLKVDQPSFSVSKEVSPAGENSWAKRTSASLSSDVDFRIQYKNTGTTDQNDVVIRDTLPQGLTYVAGSTRLTNNANSNGLAVSDNVTTGSGINIGNYGPGAAATVTFRAKVTNDTESLRCGENILTNKVDAVTRNGTRSDTADVVINVECAPDECKPGIPVGDERCTEPCVPGDNETRDEQGNCVPVGTLPSSLPTTGPAEVIAGILGVAIVSLGIAYWMRSHNAYKRALAGFTEDMTELPEEKLLEARTETHESDDK